MHIFLTYYPLTNHIGATSSMRGRNREPSVCEFWHVPSPLFLRKHRLWPRLNSQGREGGRGREGERERYRDTDGDRDRDRGRKEGRLSRCSLQILQCPTYFEGAGVTMCHEALWLWGGGHKLLVSMCAMSQTAMDQTRKPGDGCGERIWTNPFSAR